MKIIPLEVVLPIVEVEVMVRIKTMTLLFEHVPWMPRSVQMEPPLEEQDWIVNLIVLLTKKHARKNMLLFVEATESPITVLVLLEKLP